ncbi:hypothetical protein COV20_00645 [Candidatus Woesearchaeota archaeon CG10_big_fil_rev_8_21_14_0_10_45_16]|nr:MAG: hypothetical protein COV20_00645 [Candidatus Woesearchaeota archaeon CG10_big_fil_rev_8_21_14_0_10_45_16]
MRIQPKDIQEAMRKIMRYHREQGAGYTELLKYKTSFDKLADEIYRTEMLLGKDQSFKKRQAYEDAVKCGNIFFEDKEFKKARAYFERALKLFPEENYPHSKMKEIDVMLKKNIDRQEKDAVDEKDEKEIIESQVKMIKAFKMNNPLWDVK